MLGPRERGRSLQHQSALCAQPETAQPLDAQRSGLLSTLCRCSRPPQVVAWGVVACSFAAMRTKAHFYTLRLLLGAAEAGAFPGT